RCPADVDMGHGLSDMIASSQPPRRCRRLNLNLKTMQLLIDLDGGHEKRNTRDQQDGFIRAIGVCHRKKRKIRRLLEQRSHLLSAVSFRVHTMWQWRWQRWHAVCKPHASLSALADFLAAHFEASSLSTV